MFQAASQADFAVWVSRAPDASRFHSIPLVGPPILSIRDPPEGEGIFLETSALGRLKSKVSCVGLLNVGLLTFDGFSRTVPSFILLLF